MNLRKNSYLHTVRPTVVNEEALLLVQEEFQPIGRGALCREHLF
jgi:hypothetical protein